MAVLGELAIVAIAGSWCGPEAVQVLGGLGMAQDNSQWMNSADPLVGGIRPAQGGQAKTYTCPICRRLLLAMNPNTLLYPEGDHEHHHHVDTTCVVTRRKSGNLLTKAEWERSQRPPRMYGRSWWRRLFGTARRAEQG